MASHKDQGLPVDGIVRAGTAVDGGSLEHDAQASKSPSGQPRGALAKMA